MGPTHEALALADFLIAKYSLRVDRYTLAYAIVEHEEAAIRAEQEAAPSAPAEGGEDALHVAICQAVALMNMEPMTTTGLLQAHDILRKAIS